MAETLGRGGHGGKQAVVAAQPDDADRMMRAAAVLHPQPNSDQPVAQGVSLSYGVGNDGGAQYPAPSAGSGPAGLSALRSSYA